MQAQLTQLEADYGIEWQDYLLGELFEIYGTKSLDSNAIQFVEKGINFIGRTFENNGIQGKIEKQSFEPNEPFTITASVIGNYKYVKFQTEPYYCSQNINKLVPKKKGAEFKWNKEIAYYFVANIQKFVSLYDKQQGGYRLEDINNHSIKLPTIRQNGVAQIAFDFMEAFIATLKAERLATLKAERLATLKAYLTVTGLTDTTLTPAEQTALEGLNSVAWGTFEVKELFSIKNTHSILSRDIVPNSGKIPYLTAGQNNNSVGTHIEFDNAHIDEGNCIFIGGKTFVVTYQQDNFFSNDSHNLALYHKEPNRRTKNNLLFMATSIFKSLSPLYSWGDSISNKKIQKDIIQLPITKEGIPDYYTMSLVVSALQKVVIQGVVSYLDARIETTAELV